MMSDNICPHCGIEMSYCFSEKRFRCFINDVGHARIAEMRTQLANHQRATQELELCRAALDSAGITAVGVYNGVCSLKARLTTSRDAEAELRRRMTEAAKHLMACFVYEDHDIEVAWQLLTDQSDGSDLCAEDLSPEIIEKHPQDDAPTGPHPVQDITEGFPGLPQADL
jgi:hypothetical protein